NLTAENTADSERRRLAHAMMLTIGRPFMLQARAYLTLALFGALCAPAVGCNSRTGADDLELARAKKHHPSSTGAGGDGSGGGATGPTSGAGAGSAEATTGTGVPAEQVDAM